MSTNSLMPRFHYVVKNSKGQMLAAGDFDYYWDNTKGNTFVSADVAQRKIDAANSSKVKIVGKQKWVRPDYPDMSDAYVAYVD